MKTEIITVHPDFPEREQISRAAAIIQRGGIVIFPTETVYGLAADVGNAQAVDRLRRIKRRSDGKPFSIMVDQKDAFAQYSSYKKTDVFKLIDRYWPGPLTVIVPGISEQSSVGMRVPDHPVALALLRILRCAIAAPSANIEGCPPPATCQDALKDFGGAVDAAIDAGPVRYGLSSSVVDFCQAAPVVVRQGVITQADVDETVHKKTVLVVCTGNSCRSVMAEYALRHKMRDRKDIDVLSAGTSVFVTAMASSGALQILTRRGIDARRHRSQPVSAILLRKSDLILAMTRRHRDVIIQMAPDVANRTYVLNEFLGGSTGAPDSLDIADPMGQDERAYEECFQTIDAALNKVVTLL